MDDKEFMQFPVLWEGWECDSQAWIMERPDGSRYVRMTDHGCSYEAEANVIEDRIVEYERVISESRKALALLHA